MTLLTALITHLPAAQVDAQLRYLQELAPGSRFVACHGGLRDEFERVSAGPALFVDDPTLRGSLDDQSYTSVLRTLHDSLVGPEEDVDLVYVVEYDHLFLRGDFEDRLRDLARASGADFIAKNCVERNDTNWFHFHRFRDDAELNGWFARISRRDDHTTRFGCLGSGMLMTRHALEKFAALPDAPPCYLELFIPSAMHHLGLTVDDADRVGDLYATVRWRPEYTLEEALEAQRAGRAFMHPFKRLDALERLAVRRGAQKSSTRGRSG